MRESLKFAKEKFGSNLVKVCELGVAAGKNSKEIIKNLRVEKAFLIDNWHSGYNKNVFNWLKKVAVNFENDVRVFVVKHECFTAAEIFQNNYFDYLYIDDCHAPEHIYKEMELYFPKVKSGGIMAGHDYCPEMKFGRAKKAVDKFCIDNKLKIYYKKNIGEKVYDWWVVK